MLILKEVISPLQASTVKKCFEEELGEEFKGKKNLFIALGLLGDFDSFEYIQSLLPFLERLQKAKIEIVVVGIGDVESKKYFCKYTKFPENYLRVVKSSSLHERLHLERGLSLQVPQALNLMIMCLGINSPGTLSEVLRGYIGDTNSTSIFNDDDVVCFFSCLSFKAKYFNLLGKKDNLRPLELASLRLMNMTEVLCKWKIYMKNHSYLTQRPGTFLIDYPENILYSYRAKGLLCFSENMSKPIEFLDNWI